LKSFPWNGCACPSARRGFPPLGPGDILFIDSSHQVKPGSDVEFLLKAVLPLLPAGVHVHFHDIFLPDDYPPQWEWRRYNEQAAVAALIESNVFSVDVREPRARLAHPGEDFRGAGAPAARPRSDRVQPVADPALNIQPVVDWLTEGAPPSRLPRDVLLETCRRTVAAGLPIHRVGVFVRTLHPNLLGRAFIWQADKARSR
jgi:hypothetical protein